MSKYEKIKSIVCGMNLPNYRYKQIMEAVFVNRIDKFERMNNIPKSLRDVLINEFGDSFISIKPILITASNQVKKVLFSLPDGNQTEAVSLRYKRGWESFCISSGCGCAFGCKFCASGAVTNIRNLTVDEITDQILYFHFNDHNLNSISFMGMGESMSNPNFLECLSILTNPLLFGLSQRKITVSTIGIIPVIQTMTKKFPGVNLAFSLHSPFETQREELMPINKKYPLNEVMKALDEHIRHTRRRVFIAYILIEGINDSTEHADAIIRLLHERRIEKHLYHVDLIPYNPTDKTFRRFSAPSRHSIKKFSERLNSNKIRVSVRAQFGSDINAACGQLYGSVKDCSIIT